MTLLYLVLLAMLVQFSFTIPAATGDCYDDPDNNKTYNNCANCYQTLANALMNTGDNKYRLGQSFFPDNEVTSIQVRVEYVSNSISPCNTTNARKICQHEKEKVANRATRWYWLVGGFYIYQPLELFLHRSLLFSPPPWRKKCIVLCLPDECINHNVSDIFQYLTQRLKIYATFQSVHARVEASYMGSAVNGDKTTNLLEQPLAGQLHISHAIIVLGYLVPFIVIAVLLTTTIVIAICIECGHQADGSETLCNCIKIPETMCYCNRIKVWKTIVETLSNSIKSWKTKFISNIESSVDLQGNIAAATLICICVTIFAQVLDIISIIYENVETFPSYYSVGENYFYVITLLCFILTVPLNSVGIVLLSITYVERIDWMYISVILCIGNTILVLSYHFQNILIAWSLTPFYAGSILLYYGVIIFVAFLSLKYIYIWVHNLTSKNRLLLALALFITSFVLVFVIVITLLFIIYIPVDGSIESSAVGITTIYHGGVLLIGGMVAYNVGGHYIGGSFSFNTVLKTAATEMKRNPFNRNDVDWEQESEEERMSKVVNMIIKYGKVYSHLPVHLNQPPQLQDEGEKPKVYSSHIENRTSALANPGLNYPFTFQSTPIIIDGFNRPSAITVAPEAQQGVANQLQQGDVLVVERDRNCVSKIVKIDGQRQRQHHFGDAGNKDGQLNQPSGIAIGHSGNIYVVDHGNHRVQKYPQSGGASGNRARNGETGNGGVIDGGENGGANEGGENGGNAIARELKSPMGIAAAQQKVYITDTGDNRILCYSDNLRCVKTFGEVGEGNGQFKKPFDLSFDSQGNIYVVDYGNKRIQVFNAAGVYLNQFGSAILKEPVSITIDTQRNNVVYIVDQQKECVLKFSENGDFIKSFSSVELSEPSGIAVDCSSGAVYVCDTGNNRVIMFTLNQVEEL